MLLLFKNKKNLVLGLILVLMVLFLPTDKILAVETVDNYHGLPVSQSLSDPTKASNDPTGEGLTDVDGFPNYGKEIPADNMSELQSRISEDRSTIDRIADTKTQLYNEKIRIEPLTTRLSLTNMKEQAISLGSYSDKKSLSYNIRRTRVIDAMMNNADLKITAATSDMYACAYRVAEIRLKEAQASGDPASIATAQEEFNSTLESLKESRRALQEKLAFLKEAQNVECWPAGSVKPNIGNCILIATGWIGNIITYVFALLLWAVSKLFDLSVYMSITIISLWFKSSAAVKVVWQVMRDFSNIFFIFILLYIAIGTIFDLKSIGGSGGPQRMVTSVIIVALLVNFSGFFVRIVVDSSNVVAYEFYKNIGGNEAGLKTIGTKLVERLNLGNYFINAKSLSTASSEANKKFSPPQVSRLSFISIIAGTFGNILIILATSFVLLVAAILFVIRTITLLFLYVVSPLAITSQIIPKGSISSRFNKFDDWLNKLLKESFYAPAFLIPLYAVFTILGDGGISSIGGVNTNSSTSWGIIGAGSLTVVMVDILILGLIIGCIFIAQAIGAAGSGFAMGAAKKATQLASRPVSRYGGRAARGIGNWASNTGIGQNLQNRWQSGAVLGRVRQSWDTGVLRDMRQTQAAQTVGRAMRSPLASASTGVGALAGAMGVRGMENVFGTTPFSEATNQRANDYLREMRQRERPEDRAQYLEGLASGRSREEFAAVYQQLSAQERRELETAAATSNVRLAQRLREERTNLQGRAAQDTAVEQVRNNRVAGANIAATEHLSQEDLSAVYRTLNTQERAQLNQAAVGSGNNALVTRLTNARNQLGAGQQAASTRMEASEQAFEAVQGGSRNIDDIINIHPSRIIALNPNVLVQPAVATNLRVEQLNALRGQESNLTPAQRNQIRQEIDNAMTQLRALQQGGGALPPANYVNNLNRINTWLNGPGSDF